MASTNGRVLQITGVSAGRAKVDLDGDGIAEDPATLAGLGISDSELERLAELFAPGGQSLWRVPVRHFSAWDLNWPRQPPSDAERPDLDPMQASDYSDPCTAPGSVVELKTRP